MSNIFINIDQIVDLKEYTNLQNQLKEQNIPFLDCLEGIFIEEYKNSKFTRSLEEFYKDQVETTSNKPLIISDNFYTTYDLSDNYYAIINKQELDIEKTFKNFLYHIKKDFKYGLYIDRDSLKITYHSDKQQVVVNFFYTLNTANRNNIKGIQLYLKNRYRKLLRKYSLIKNEH